jgi:hypothetical protein
VPPSLRRADAHVTPRRAPLGPRLGTPSLVAVCPALLSAQLIAATPDGRRSLTFSATTQITDARKPALLRKLRAVEENFVCALPAHRR